MGDNTWEVINAERERVGAKSQQQLIVAWLIRRGCHVLVKSSGAERALDNKEAAALSLAPGWSENPLSELADGSETVNMVEGEDACAAVFRAMGEAADDAAKC